MGSIQRRSFLCLGLAATAMLPMPAHAQSIFGDIITTPRVRRLTTSTPPQRFSSGAGVALINTLRAARGRDGVAANGTLAAMAQSQARAMAAADVLSHHIAGSLKDRAARAGYRGPVAENLASGQPTFEEALHAWLDSGYHRTTLLSERYTRAGAAVALIADIHSDPLGIYWCIILGT